MKKNEKSKDKKYNQVVNAWHEKDPNIPSDVLGSYTGVPQKDKLHTAGERPTQDADDL